MRRNRYDIYFEILDVCREEQCVTYVIQKCRLSYAEATRCLTHLNDRGFLKRNGTSFKSTGEGLILLEESKKLFKKLNSVSGA